MSTYSWLTIVDVRNLEFFGFFCWLVGGARHVGLGDVSLWLRYRDELRNPKVDDVDSVHGVNSLHFVDTALLSRFR